MNIGKLYQVTSKDTIPVFETPEILFSPTIDVLNPESVFIPLEDPSASVPKRKGKVLEIVKVCTPNGVKGYAAFFFGSSEYKQVSE